MMLAVAAAVLSFTSCAPKASESVPSVPPDRPSPAASTRSQSIEERAQLYWNRRQAKDLTGAHPYYCLAYRAKVPLAEYLLLTRLVRFDLRNIQVSKIALDQTGNRAAVTITYAFVFPTLPDQLAEAEATDTWLREADGTWCKEDEPIALPFPSGQPGGPPVPPGVQPPTQPGR
jgi:hypothetical protein